MRGSGILMHITSLPSPYGVGTMGQEAYAFIDFLAAAGQTHWQILPLTPTGYGDSPYQSCSAYAGNHYLIDLDLLVGEGLLSEDEITGIDWCETCQQVDFGRLYQNRLPVLRKAYQRFAGHEAFDQFCSENSAWLSDFSLFMALKEQFDGKPWFLWDEPLKRRDSDAVWNARQTLKETIRFYSFVQYLFFRQWDALRRYASEKNIRIIGDVPIYVPMDSCDVWVDPELFQLDENLDPTAVAGCPPDAFSEDGQLWGNPLYRWDVMAKDGYDWWIRRLSAAGRLYDVVRLDHFRGFEAYWAVPYGEATARNGSWVKGPDKDFICTVQRKLPDLELIAEDLGFLTQEVLNLRDESGLPGMKVLEFAFDPQEPSDYLPHTYTANTVCYTGTHDNMPLHQWFQTASPETAAYAAAYVNLGQEESLVWGVIRTAYASVSKLCVVQMQDYLELGAEARMNFPGVASGNWVWRMTPGSNSDALAQRIGRLAALYGRTQTLS